MSIRLRRVDGSLVALCAVECDPMPGDVHLDDEVHAALATKFAVDWGTGWEHPKLAELAASQKVRDAQEELNAWLAAAPYRTNTDNHVLLEDHRPAPESRW
jgi:hypothetical protein